MPNTPSVTPAQVTLAQAAEELAENESRSAARHFFKTEDWWAAAATFLFSTVVFYYNMAPEVTLQDSGELVTGAFNFGGSGPCWATSGAT